MKVIVASIGAILLSATPAAAQNTPATSGTPDTATAAQTTTTTTAKSTGHKAIHHRVTHKRPRHRKVVRHVHKTKVKASIKTSTTRS